MATTRFNLYEKEISPLTICLIGGGRCRWGFVHVVNNNYTHWLMYAIVVACILRIPIQNIDFATIHAYPDIWLSGQSDSSQMVFMQRWMSNHWTDSRRIIKKPLLIGEFGKSNKDAGYNVNGRDAFMSSVYRNIYNYAINGGTLVSLIIVFKWIW